jgi:hypothetical protein
VPELHTKQEKEETPVIFVGGQQPQRLDDDQLVEEV